jgi:hypothetical protein
MTFESLKKIDIQSTSWEYASEMVVKSGLLKLKSAEVPIHFYKDREGRESHHKRSGWFSPWHAGWINLKVMLLYAPNQMIFKPGILFLLSGLFLILMQIGGPVSLGAFKLGIGAMILGLTFSVLGFSAIQMAILVESFSSLSRFYESKALSYLREFFTYTKGMIVGGILSSIGFLFSLVFVYDWYMKNFQLETIPWYVIFGLMLIIFGFQTVMFNLVYQAFMITSQRK